MSLQPTHSSAAFHEPGGPWGCGGQHPHPQCGVPLGALATRLPITWLTLKTALKLFSITEMKTGLHWATPVPLSPKCPRAGRRAGGPWEDLPLILPASPFLSRWGSTTPDLLSILSLATRGQGLVRPGPNFGQGHGLGDARPGFSRADRLLGERWLRGCSTWRCYLWVNFDLQSCLPRLARMCCPTPAQKGPNRRLGGSAAWPFPQPPALLPRPWQGAVPVCRVSWPSLARALRILIAS